ncbi:MAG: sugar ABC transporter ATP-binding protein [Candidatus Binatia bacterium]
MQDGALLEARGLVARYGATTALDGVDLTLYAGEVHAVVGENGAGKSTLLRVLADAVRPAKGTLHSRGGTRLDWVPQETVLPADLTAAAWIFLGHEIRGALGTLQERAMQRAAATALQAVGCNATPTARLGTLAVTQRKQVQLARALHAAPDVLLLDEPTAVLGEAETAALFAQIRARRQRGTAVLYVSHRLDEVLAIADRVTVLRDGQRVSTDTVTAVDVATLVRRMVGRDVQRHWNAERSPGAVLLRLDDVATAHVRGLSLSVRRGEVLGLAGLVGAGRSEVLEAIAGLRPLRGGRIDCATRPVFVPEDRGSKGLVSTLRLRENLFLPADGWLLHRARERRDARAWIERLGIRASGTEAAIDALSGGNQQKLLLARALRHTPQLLLLDEPTAGVDVGAKAEIHDLIAQLAARGTGVLMASSDLPELLGLCDRIVALRGGRRVAVLAVTDATEPRVAALITGAAA